MNSSRSRSKSTRAPDIPTSLHYTTPTQVRPRAPPRPQAAYPHRVNRTLRSQLPCHLRSVPSCPTRLRCAQARVLPTATTQQRYHWLTSLSPTISLVPVQLLLPSLKVFPPSSSLLSKYYHTRSIQLPSSFISSPPQSKTSNNTEFKLRLV